jgi:hypothetical protein
MEKEFIPYQQALDLKELGFDEPCIKYYWTDGMFTKTYESPFNHNKRDNLISAPLYQQAFRWFREKYRLDGKPEYFLNDWYCFIINDMKGEDNSRRLFTEFPSHEEAELECLKKLIEIVKEKFAQVQNIL